MAVTTGATAVAGGVAGRVTGRVAVLARKGLATNPYAAWLSGAEVVLVAQDGDATRRHLAGDHGYASTRLFPDWKRNRAVDVAVVDAHRRRPLDRLVAQSECDQVRAGRLRDHLGIAGQSEASARAYRDKGVMKALVAAGGVPVPAWARADTVWDVVDFAAGRERVVVKPVDGAGAVGVVDLRVGDELDAWLTARSFPWDEPARLLVEEHVAGPVLLVDGIMAGGEVLVALASSYGHSCYRALAGLEPLDVVHLDPASPAARRALDLATAAVAALPGPAEPTSFHCELFDHPERGAVFCEIACRTGGGRINDCARLATGVDLELWSCLGQAGVAAGELPRVAPRGPAGFVLVPSPGRVLASAPDACPLPGVLDFRLHVRPGQPAPRAEKATQSAAEVVFAAEDHAGLATCHAEVMAWLDRALVWA